MKKKATLKDIAALANVSVATVSYVLNNVPNQTIADHTRESIRQIAKELNYVPNLAARSLVKQRSGLVGILLNKTSGLPFWSRNSHMSLVESLEQLLTGAGYHTLLVSLIPEAPAMDIIRERKLEAVFVVDPKDDMFYRISSNFMEGVPVILLNSRIEDPLFNQVNYNYPLALEYAAAASTAPPCLIMEQFHNAALTEWIAVNSRLSRQYIYEVSNESGSSEALEQFIQMNNDRHFIIINEFLAAVIAKIIPASRLTVLCTCGLPEIVPNGIRTVTFRNNRAETAFEVMQALGSGDSLPLAGANQFLVDVAT
ncbi:LacI family DNA-binding transcriptional regulator [Paenibacillus tengchongensis]|uniref:LacI family DNA-binding transcriptional regulator n=1 Tax=Paenibacillus tengchongensis TaxID=2608684 RepID=UPI00124E2312|nr:LacI family DNA-binding transcriptional regulator [Paenibacillus tengchongensis]